MTTRSDIAKKIWDVIVTAYGQGGRTRVVVPPDDIMDILLSVAGNVLAGVPDANERLRLIRDAAPKLVRFVDTVRQKSTSLHIPSKSPLVLPN